MTTEAEFQAWLQDDSAIRTVLIEVGVLSGGSEITRYISSKSYITGSTDSPANTHYVPLISGGIEFTESIAVDGDFSINYGDIELNNFDGSIDEWIDDVWENRNINVFVGDVSWERSDFYQVFSGVVSTIDVRDRTTLNLKIVDKLQRLNTTITDTKIGGTGTNADNLIPVTFGECHNVTPVLVDEAHLEYAYHTTDSEGVIEVRDNGVPVSFTDVGTGRFRLNQSVYGTITASVQGDSTTSYTNTAPGLIKRLATAWGTESDKRFDLSEIDTDNFDDVEADYPHPCGVFLTDKGNVLDICNSLAQSIGHRLTVTRAGKLRLVRLSLPRSDSGNTVTADDMVFHSLKVESIPTVVAGVQLGYCKNWTVQDNLTTGIPSPHIELYAQEWLTVTRTSSTASTDYKLHTEPDMRETYLLTEADAITEANNELALFNTRRKILTYTGLPHLLTEVLGNTQTIQHSRFGLSSGVAGQIVKIKTDWLKMRAEISVFL